MKKRIISIILSLAVIITMASSPVSAASNDSTYDLTLSGFIDWMQDTKTLSDKQKTDLTSAKKIITEAEEESFLKWAGGSDVHFSDDRNDKILDLTDPNDAANLRQMPAAISIMKRINELRKEDDNYAALGMKDGRTNFYIMSIAAAGAMRGAGLKRHSSLKTSCENLAWGGLKAADMWYSEKTRFNQIKDTLGIATIDSLDQIKAIKDYADENKITIGHYTNMFWSADQAMAIGYTPYYKTACFNATKSSNYNSYALYKIEEFEALVKEFCRFVGTHDFGEGETLDEPTCTEAGKTLYECSICGETEEKEIAPQGHQWKQTYTVDVPATCKDPGEESIHCSVCESVKEGSEREIPRSEDHVYGDWITINDPTYTEAGLKEHECTVCGNIEESEIPVLNRQSLSEASVSGIVNKKYTGKEVEQDFVVKLAGKELQKNVDYSIDYKNNVNAGTAVLEIEGQGAYKDVITKEFRISKAVNTLVVTAKKVSVNYTKLKKKARTIKRAKVLSVKKAVGKVTYTKKSGNKKILINKKTGKVTVKKGLKKGTYRVKVKVRAAGDRNYKELTKTKTIKIVVR